MNTFFITKSGEKYKHNNITNGNIKLRGKHLQKKEKKFIVRM